MIYVFVAWAIAVIGLTLGITYYKKSEQSSNYNLVTEIEIDFSEFMASVESKKITEVRFNGGYLYGLAPYTRRSIVYTKVPKMSYRLIQYFLAKGVRIGVENSNRAMLTIAEFILQTAMFLIFGFAVLYLFQRRRNFFGGGWFASNAKQVDSPGAKFSDVAGVDNAKDALSEVVSFLKSPEKFKRLGATIPRGVLLYGPPGTGKTLLARCTAGESNSAFLYASGASFVNLYVGQGAKNVRELFKLARDKSPAIIFIDEIDALAGKRLGAISGGGSDEHAHALTELLAEMDGFDQGKDCTVVVIAATNRLDVLDDAVLRPGRFDRKIYVGLPDIIGRKKILEIYLQKIKCDKDIDVDTLSKKTRGFSGADIKHIVNEAALYATLDEDRETVNMSDFNHAWNVLQIGPRRHSYRTEERTRLVAYHEAGHAIAGSFTPGSNEIHSITIVPHGDAEGVVIHLLEEEMMPTKEMLIANIIVSLAGRAAEELVFGPDKVTTGACSDFLTATKIADKMVFLFGMGQKNDLIAYPDQDYHLLSNQMRNERSVMMQEIIKDCSERCMALLKEKRGLLDKLVEYLLERETISGEELQIILRGEELPPFVILTKQHTEVVDSTTVDLATSASDSDSSDLDSDSDLEDSDKADNSDEDEDRAGREK